MFFVLRQKFITPVYIIVIYGNTLGIRKRKENDRRRK